MERPDCEIVAVVDIQPEFALRELDRVGITAPIYTDVDVALAEVKPELVYDLSFVTTHLDITTKCLKAGCNVMTEKPLTVDRESANLG